MRKQRLFLIGFLICLFLLCVFLLIGFYPVLQKKDANSFAPIRVTVQDQTNINETKANDSTGSVSNDTIESTITCPVDFSSLKSINSDIYAWIDVPGTDISYPVVQNSKDDTFYLDHNSNTDFDINGAIFTEHTYTSTSFDDPVTILYGHDMRSGEMFGCLQENYTNKSFFDKNNEIIVYTPEKELHYKLFASTPYYSLHLLYYYDFKKSYIFDNFFDELYNYKTVNSIFSAEDKPKAGEKVIILSTCMDSGENKRYLVMGTLKSIKLYN